MSILVILVVFLLLILIYGWVLQRYVIRRISVKRQFKDAYVYCGDTSEMIETIINPTPFLIPWLRIESRISPYLQFGNAENLAIQGDMYHLSLFTVKGYQQIVRHHKVHFLRRGVYNVGSAALTLGDITGLFTVTCDQKTDMHVIVYPRITDTRDLPSPLNHLSGVWSKERRILHDPFMIRNIRDYMYGDPYKDIHWAASARTQQLQVKIHEDEAMIKLMVIINAQTREDQWDDLMDYEQTAIENHISLAAAICLEALRNGMQAGFATNMPLLGANKDSSTYIDPQMRPGWDEMLLAYLAQLQVHRTLRFPSFLDTIQFAEDTAYLVLSCYDSSSLQTQLEKIRSQGYEISLHVSQGAM